MEQNVEGLTVSPNGQQTDVSRRFYSMGLLEFEAFKVNGITHYVKRVPGGWVMYNHNETAMCFVPYNNEFQNGG